MQPVFDVSTQAYTYMARLEMIVEAIYLTYLQIMAALSNWSVHIK